MIVIGAVKENDVHLDEGGEGMVEETIKAVKEAERQAEQLVKEADKKCAEILEAAKGEADQIKKTAIADAKRQADEALAETVKEGKEAAGQAMAEMETQIADLKQTAKTRKKDAIDAVIAKLV